MLRVVWFLWFGDCVGFGCKHPASRKPKQILNAHSTNQNGDLRETVLFQAFYHQIRFDYSYEFILAY